MITQLLIWLTLVLVTAKLSSSPARFKTWARGRADWSTFDRFDRRKTDRRAVRSGRPYASAADRRRQRAALIATHH